MATNSAYVNRQIAKSINKEPNPNVTTGIVTSVEPVSRICRVRIGGSPDVSLRIITQELTDQLYTLHKSGDRPTVKIEQDVVIAYNGQLPVYPQMQGILMPRVMGWYASDTTIGPVEGMNGYGPRQEPMVLSNIVDIRGNVKTPPTGDLVLDFQVSYDPSPAGVWTSILTVQPRIVSGDYDLSFAGGPFVAEQHLSVQTIDAGQFVRLQPIAPAPTAAAKGLTAQMLLVAELFVQ